MKIALYIEDGLEQIVLTPETETERGILRKIEDESREITIKRGSFFECRGGWVRYKDSFPEFHGVGRSNDDQSTMIVLRPKREADAGNAEN